MDTGEITDGAAAVVIFILAGKAVQRCRYRVIELGECARFHGAMPVESGGVLIELVEKVPSETPVQSLEIREGSAVLVYLQEPREKLWGLLRRIDSAGLMLQGIDLSSFDDWISQVDHDEESVVGPTSLFIPMRRVEKMLLDQASGNIPSLADRFKTITGRTVHEVLGEL